MSSSIIRPIAGSITLISSYGLYSSYHSRPKPDIENGKWGGPSHYPEKTVTEKHRGQVEGLSDDRKVGESYKERLRNNTIGESIGSSIIVNLISLVINAGMRSPSSPLPYNHYHPVPSSHYLSFLNLLNNQSPDETVVTVSNHCSTIDDPTLFGCILSTPLPLSPFPHHTWPVSRLRWSLCSQEICFKHPLSSTFFGGGRVLPVKRGAGIDQPLLHDFASIAGKGGEWVHMFPEGKIYQGGKVGREYYNCRSEEEARRMGRLKWGIGKVIAHCPKKVRIVPFHHVGMEGVVPQYETGELKGPLPMGGSEVSLRFGEEVDVEDIIEEHEKWYGKVWKYGEGRWKSEDSDRELYSKITRRLEEKLIELEKEADVDDMDGVRKGREIRRRNFLESEQVYGREGGGKKKLWNEE